MATILIRTPIKLTMATGVIYHSLVHSLFLLRTQIMPFTEGRFLRRSPGPMGLRAPDLKALLTSNEFPEWFAKRTSLAGGFSTFMTTGLIVPKPSVVIQSTLNGE